MLLGLGPLGGADYRDGLVVAGGVRHGALFCLCFCYITVLLQCRCPSPEFGGLHSSTLLVCYIFFFFLGCCLSLIFFVGIIFIAFKNINNIVEGGKEQFY